MDTHQWTCPNCLIKAITYHAQTRICKRKLQGWRHISSQNYRSICIGSISTGYKDKHLPWKWLSLLKHINCICDSEAKRFLWHTHEVVLRRRKICTTEVWRCSFRKKKFIGDSHPLLLYHIFRANAKKFLASRHCILCDAFDNIDWGAVEKGLQSLILAFQVWAVNHLRRLCGTSNIVVPMGSWDNYTCPCFHM